MLIRLAVPGVAAAIVGALLWASHAHPVRQLVPVPPTDVLAPGIGIKVTGSGRSETVSCTAGFLVRTKDDRQGLLSAGHCNKPIGPGKVAVHHSGLYPTVGVFTESVYDGNDWNDSDIGLITLKELDKIPVTSEVDGHPVVGLADRVEIGDMLCHLGIRSGEPMCGPVTASEQHKVRFSTSSTCGDAGGPAYVVRPDGAVEAVGILTAVADGEDPEATCEGTREYTVVQLIKPWLEAWQLTLVTTTP